MSDVDVRGSDRKVMSAPFLNVARQHIQVVMPGS